MPDFDPMQALAEIQNTLSADQGYRQAWIQANPDKARELGAVEYESGLKSPLTPEEHATLGAAPAGEIPQTLDAIAGTVNADAQYRQQYLTDNWRKMTDGQSAAKMSQAWNDVDPATLPKIKYPTGYEEPVTREELAWVASQRNSLVSGLIRENPAQALTGLVAEPQDPHAPLTRDAFGNINREAVVQKLTRLRLTPAERLMAAQEYRRQQSADPNSSMHLGAPGSVSFSGNYSGDPLYWVNRLPFAGPGMEAALALKAKDAITKIADDDKNGTNKATDDDYLMWSAYQERARVEQERSGKWPTWWVDNVSKLPGYVGEFVATSGTVNPVSRSVGVAAARRLGTGMLARTAGRATGVLVGEGLVRTALRPTSVAAEAAKSQVPDAQISYGAGGSPSISVTPGMGAGEATLRGIGKVGAENVSESLISDALTSLIPKGAPPILKSIFGKEKKGIVEQMRATSKFENFPVQMAEEYLNDVLEYPLNTPDENKQSVITAIATGDYKTVADDFLRKAAVLGPFSATSAAAERLAQGEPQAPVEAPPRQTAPSVKTRGWIGTPNWPPEGINLQTVTDPELRQHLVVNDLSRRMHTQIDQGGRTTKNFERYGREFAAADPVAANAIIDSGRSSLAKIREHFPGFPDVSGVEGDNAVRSSFVAGLKTAFGDYENNVYWPRAERNLPFVKLPEKPTPAPPPASSPQALSPDATPAAPSPLLASPQPAAQDAPAPSPPAMPEAPADASPPEPSQAPAVDSAPLDEMEKKLADRMRRKRESQQDDWHAIQSDQELRQYLSLPAGTPDGDTVQSHTDRVVRAFDESHDREALSSIAEAYGIPRLPRVVRAAIALHDIGKGVASADGKRHEQHSYTRPIAERALQRLGFSEKESALALALIDHDTIGMLLQGKLTPNQAADEIKRKAASVGVRATDFLSMNSMYYKADVAAYPSLKRRLIASNGNKMFVANTRFGILEEIIHGNVRETPWLSPVVETGRTEPSGGEGNRGDAGFVHGTAIRFSEFSGDKDSGNNRFGPGAYLVDSRDRDVAEHYARRAVKKLMSLFDVASRERIANASKTALQKMSAYAKAMSEKDESASKRPVWLRASEVLDAIIDDKFGEHAIDVEFSPSKTLDLGAEESGGAILSDAEHASVMAAFPDASELSHVRRAVLLYDALAHRFGRAVVNQRLLSAGYDSLHFVHRQGGFSRPYSVFVSLRHDNVSIPNATTSPPSSSDSTEAQNDAGDVDPIEKKLIERRRNRLMKKPPAEPDATAGSPPPPAPSPQALSPDATPAAPSPLLALQQPAEQDASSPPPAAMPESPVVASPPEPPQAPAVDSAPLDEMEQKLAERMRRKRFLKPAQPESTPTEPAKPQAAPSGSHPEPWQMSYKELRDALNPGTRDELEKARPLLAKLYKPGDGRVTASEADDPWGIYRAIHKGDQMPRVPMHDLSLRHKEAIREALKEGKQVPKHILDEYDEFSNTQEPTRDPSVTRKEPDAPNATSETPPASTRGAVRGSSTSVQVYGDKSHPAEYRVVPLESLVSSHTFADGNVTSNIKREIYPPELQENDYSIGTPHYFKVENNAKAKVANYWVSDNPDAINGPPIIGNNNLVINGNGRTMTLQLAAHNNDYQWYRDALDQKASQFGIDPAAYADMKHPVLVRAVDMDERTPEAFAFAKEANRPATMQNSLRDQAASYVDLLPAEAFSTIEADDIGTMRAFIKDSPTGRRFVEKLFERFPEQSRKVYFTHSPDGLSLTGAGEELVTNILAVAAVPKDTRALLQRNAPGLDNNLTANSSAILALKVKDRTTYDDFLKAVEYVGENPSLKTMRDLNDDLRTGRMFRDPLTEKQKSLARFVFKNYNSPAKLRDGLRAMVRDVAFTKPGNSLFGTPEPATQSDIDSMLGLTPEDASADAPSKKSAPKAESTERPPAAPPAPASTAPFGEMSIDEKKKDAYKDMSDALADMREVFKTPPHRMGIEPVEMKLIRATVKLLRGAVKLGVANFEDFVAMARDVIGDELLDQVSDYLRDAWEIGIEESKPGGEFGGFTLQPTDLEGKDVIESLRRKDPSRKRASDDSPPRSAPPAAVPPTLPPSATPKPPSAEPPPAPVDMTIADKRQELRTTYGLDVQEVGGRTFTVFNSAKLGSKQFGKNKDAIKALGGRYERSNSNWYFRGTDPTEKLYDAVTQESPQKGAPGYRDRRGLPDGIEFGRDGRLLPPSPIPGREGQQGPEENGVITARWEYTEDVDTEVVPASLVGKLTKHQLQGAAKAIKSMLKVGGFLLADGAGVGKTRQILTVAKYFADQGKKVLIVTMNQAIESPFAQKKEGVDEVSLGSYSKDGKDMGVDVKLLGDGDLEESTAAFKPGQIHITAYHEGKFADSIIAKDQRAPTGLWRLVDADTVLILDEAHEAKNAQAKKPRANQIYKATEAAGMVMIATATPGDKIYHMAYLKRTGMMLGMDEDRWMEAAGLYRSKNQSGSVWQTQPGLSNEELLRRLGTIWDHMTRQGHMVKREMSFSRVESEFVHLKLDPKAHGVLDHITRVYEEHFPSINGMVKARLLMARRVNQEPFKIGAAVEQIKNELHEGRQVIVFLWRVNANETVLRVNGEVIPITESEGTVKQLREALAAIGVEDMVELHSNSKQETAEAVRRFQAGESKVMLATVQSGGTGINLDDTTGKNPRTIIVMTPPWTPSDVVQLVGRGMRLTTKSNLRVKWLFGDTDVDSHAETLIHAKMSLLRAIVKGAVSELDPSQAKLMQDMESPIEDDARVRMTSQGPVAFSGSSYRTKADVPPPYNMNEDASQNPKGTVVYNPMQIAAQMRAEFDLPMNRGRLQLRKKGVTAEYDGHYEVMGVDNGREGNLSNIFHELAHHLDKLFGLTDFLSSNAKTAAKLGSAIEDELYELDYEQDPKKGRRAGEGFAEWLKVYMLHDPAYAEQIAPKTYAWFQRWLKLQPKTAKKLAMIRGMAQAYVKATPGERAAVHRADNPKRVQLPMSLSPSVTVSAPPVRTPATLSKFAEAVVDATLTNLTEEARPLWKFGNEYQRRGGQFDPEGGFLHPAVWYEAVDTAGAGGFYGMNIPLYSPDGTRILAPAYSEILQNSGFDSDSDEYAKFADYHQSKRMLRLYDESGGKYQVPGDRDQLVRNIAVVENNPTLKAKAEAFSKALTDWDNAFMGWMKEMGAISNQEEMDMLDAHGADYASLMREIPNDSMFLKPRSSGSSAAGSNPYQYLSKKGSMAPLIDPIAATVIRVQRGMQYAFRRRTEAAILRMLQDTSVSGLGKFAMIVRPTMEETVIALDRMLKQLDDLGALRYSRQVIRGVNMIRNGLTDAVPKTWLKLIAKEFGVTVKWKDRAAVDAFIDDIENGRVSRMGHHGKVETVDDIPSVNAELSFWDPKMENDAYSRVVVMRDANSRPYLVRLNPELHDLLGVMAFDTPGFGTMVFNMAGRMVSTGAIAFNPSWAVKNAFGDVHGSFAKSEQQSAKPADIAEQIAMLVPNMTRAFFNAWMPNASRKALSAAYGLFSSTGAQTAGDQAMGGAYWREYERAGFTTGHATSEQPAAVASNVRRLFGQGLLRRVKANLSRKQLATAAGDVSGALADKISFSDVVARFPEFVATINRLGFFEDADGNWVRRRFDAAGKVVSEVKYAALPQGVLSAATAAARDVSLNYWRKGRLNKKYGKSLGPFLWAAFAGTNMLRRNVEAALNHPDPAVRERVRRRLLYWTAAQVIGTAINWLLNHDEEWYQENLQRDAKYIYKYHNILDQHGNVIARFPRGYNYSAPSILTEGLLNSMEAEVKGSGHKAASQIALQALSPAVRDQLPFQSFWQMISQVPLAGPVIDVAANTSYDGRPIVSRDLADLLPGAQVKPSTSIIARKLGQLFPNSVSPVQLDYLMDQLAGGFPGNYIDAVEALAKGHVAEGFRRLFLGGLTPWTENQQSIDALYDRGAELRRLEQSKEWIAENGIDAEEPDVHEQKVIAYTMRMLSAIGRDNKGFTKEERAAHDRLRIGTARAALNKDPLPLYPDAFSKGVDLPSKSLEEKRDEFLVSFVRTLSSNKPTSLTAREKEAGKSLDDKVRRWEADRVLAVSFLKKKGYTREDAVNLYKKRYGKEVGREAIRNSTHRIIKSFTDSEGTQTQTSW